MLKKVFSIILILTLFMALSACRKNDRTSIAESSNTSSADSQSEDTGTAQDTLSTSQSESSTEETVSDAPTANGFAQSNHESKSATTTKQQQNSKPSTPSKSSQVAEEPKDTTPPQTPAVEEKSVVTKEAVEKIKQRFLELVNIERAGKGLSSLTLNNALDDAANIRSIEILSTFSHTRPDGTLFYTAIDTNRYPNSYLGENIGQGCIDLNFLSTETKPFTGTDAQINAVALSLFTNFKNSPPHYESILNERYKFTGIGISYQIYEGFKSPIFFIAHIFGA